MAVRNAEAAELYELGRIWFDGWRDAHVELVPPELTRLRTAQSFRDRLFAHWDQVRVIERAGVPVGFCLTKASEVHQLYVSSEARGSGVAATLIRDAEARLSAGGVRNAWLACAIGNERAARFYEKHD